MARSLPDSLVSRYFRANVGVLLTRGGGSVLVGRRTDVGDWQMPQGGLRPGESVLEAARRELDEEILGIDDPTLVAACTRWLGEHPLWLGYELPEPTARIGRGQVQKWVYLEFTGDDELLDAGLRRILERAASSGARPEFDRWRWIDLDALADQIWPAKRAVYEAVAADLHRCSPERRSSAGQ